MEKIDFVKKLALISIGIVFGIGSYTFYYAKGYSYAFNNPEACKNCHVMEEHYDAWHKSSHHAFTVCNDCHLPHDIPYKYIAKGLIGSKHSYYFTVGNFPEPIRIGKDSREIAEENCIRCHAHMAGAIHEAHIKKLECTSCHSNVGHY